MNWMAQAKQRVLRGKIGRRNPTQVRGRQSFGMMHHTRLDTMRDVNSRNISADLEADKQTSEKANNKQKSEFKKKKNMTRKTTEEQNSSTSQVESARCVFTPDNVRLFNDGKEVNECGRCVFGYLCTSCITNCRKTQDIKSATGCDELLQAKSDFSKSRRR
ncbi:hypothetical protein AC1031_021983 [Aphanomyces cochlioides]|nr:hypothetical protein AC1031_021983 [Aphanomyces cochlioides]